MLHLPADKMEDDGC